MATVGKDVREFALIGFLLLAVLFGMNIMAFIFGNLGPANAGLEAGSNAFNSSLAIQNASLDSINTYASASSSQFTTLSVSIILILLLAVFAIFWKAFMGGKKKSGTMGGGGQFS